MLRVCKTYSGFISHSSQNPEIGVEASPPNRWRRKQGKKEKGEGGNCSGALVENLNAGGRYEQVGERDELDREEMNCG